MSQKAVSFIHDILTEVLTDWNEPPHFHFHEALFRPFERIMQLELCDEDVQDQVSATLPFSDIIARGSFQSASWLSCSSEPGTFNPPSNLELSW